MDAEKDLAELRDRIEARVGEYVEMVNDLERLSQSMTGTRVVPPVYRDD